MTKADQAKQKAFESGSDYAVTYLCDLIDSMAATLDAHDSGAASLLRYVGAKAAEYNCGEYAED